MTEYSNREAVSANCNINRCSKQRHCCYINCSCGIATTACTGYGIDKCTRGIKQMTEYSNREAVSANCNINRCSKQRHCCYINCSCGIATTACTGHCIDERTRCIKQMTKYRCRECILTNCYINCRRY